MGNEDWSMNENPYASPEEVAEGKRSWLPEQRTRAGLGWMLISAVCSLGWYGLLMFMAFGAFGVLGVHEAEAFTQADLMLSVIGVCLPVLIITSAVCVLLAVWRLLQGVDQRTLTVSWVAWLVGWGLMVTIYLSPLGVIVWGVSFWFWYLYLEDIGWINDQPDMSRLALFLFITGAAWCVLVLILILVAMLTTGDPYIANRGSSFFAVAGFALLTLPGAYLLMEVVLLGRLWMGMRKMENVYD